MRRQEVIESNPKVPAWGWMLLALLVLVASHVATAPSGPFPARLRSYLTDTVRITGKDIEAFERGRGFKVTKRISAPPRLEDFSALRLPDEDLDDLRSCRVGDCDIKLGEQALRRFRSEIKWSAPNGWAEANSLMQR